MQRSRVYLDIAIGSRQPQRVVLQLYDDIVPKTVLNFISIVKGTVFDNTTLSYKGSFFHRVIKNFMIQGGDFTRGDGTGGMSIWGEKFEDEKSGLELKLDRPGLLAMANAGPNTNGSQFFITTVDTPHLNGKHVVFGEVIKGMDVVREVEYSETLPNDKPVYDVKIAECGVLEEGQDDGVVVDAADPYPTFPADLRQERDIQGAVPKIEELIKFSDAIRERGNEFYKNKDLDMALKKYDKALRYLNFEDYPSPSEKASLEERKIKVFLNISAVLLAQKQYSEAIDYCTKTLALDKDNVKALGRRGQAYLHSKDYDEASSDLKRVLELSPDDVSARKHLLLAAKKKKELFEKQSKAYAGFFS